MDNPDAILVDTLDQELKLGLRATWCRASIARGLELREGKPQVDRVNRIIYGFSVVTKGPAIGHGLIIDDVTLNQVVERGNAAKRGIKARFDHPNASNTSMGSAIGRARNFRRDGDRVRADLHLLESTKTAPGGDRGEYVLDLAEEAPDLFGASMVFDGQHEEQLDDDGKPARDEEGRRLPKLARVEHLYATDVVDEPAANPSGMFSADSLAAKVSAFLNRWAEHDLLPKLRSLFSQSTPTKEVMMEKPEKQTDAQALAETERQAAFDAGVREERERVKGIRAVMLRDKNGRPLPGMEEVAEELIEIGATVEEAQKAFKLHRLSQLTEKAPQSAGGGEDQQPQKKADLTKLPPDERYRYEWEASPALQAEFGRFETYRAFRKAEDRGQIQFRETPGRELTA